MNLQRTLAAAKNIFSSQDFLFIPYFNKLLAQRSLTPGFHGNKHLYPAYRVAFFLEILMKAK